MLYLEKELKLTAQFKHLQSEDFDLIKEQVERFQYNNKEIDLINIISENDDEPYLSDVYIQDNYYILDVINYNEDKYNYEHINIVTLPLKYGDNDEVKNEIINYTIMCLFYESSLIYKFFKYFGRFSINIVDRVSNI